MAASNPLNSGLFVPSNYIWDVSQLYSTDTNDPEAMKELLLRLYQNINNITVALNLKDSGYYNTQEFVNGQAYYPNPALNSSTPTSPVFRQVYRKVINFGALPGGAIPNPKTVAHNIPITAAATFTRIYATASNNTASTFIPIPYSSAVAVANNIELSLDATNVIITSGGVDYSAYTTTYVVVEYLKS